MPRKTLTRLFGVNLVRCSYFRVSRIFAYGRLLLNRRHFPTACGLRVVSRLFFTKQDASISHANPRSPRPRPVWLDTEDLVPVSRCRNTQQAMQYVQIGLISMGLTIVNISSIYVAGVWLFIFKEVAPVSFLFYTRRMVLFESLKTIVWRACLMSVTHAVPITIPCSCLFINVHSQMLHLSNARRDQSWSGLHRSVFHMVR